MWQINDSIPVLKTNLLIFLICAFLVGCSKVPSESNSALRVPAPGPVEATHTATSADELSIPPSQLMSRVKAAAAGNVKASEELALSFGADNDERESYFWLQIAAENGSLTGMQHLAMTLRAKGGEINCLRALFWLNQIRKRGTAVDVAQLNVESAEASIRADLPVCAPYG